MTNHLMAFVDLHEDHPVEKAFRKHPFFFSRAWYQLPYGFYLPNRRAHSKSLFEKEKLSLRKSFLNCLFFLVGQLQLKVHKIGRKKKLIKQSVQSEVE